MPIKTMSKPVIISKNICNCKLLGWKYVWMQLRKKKKKKENQSIQPNVAQGTFEVGAENVPT